MGRAVTIFVGGLLSTSACSDGAAPDGYLVTSLSYAELFVGDSVLVRAQRRNAAGTPEEPVPEVHSLTPDIVFVGIDQEQSARPVPELVFWIEAVGVGRGEVAVVGERSDTAWVIVQAFPASFDGTVTPRTAGFADRVTIAPGSVPWDGDEWVSVGDVRGIWVESRSLTSLVIRMPGLSAPGTHDLVVHDQGPLDLTLGTPIDVTSVFVPHAAAPGANLTGAVFPRTFFIQLGEDARDDYYYVAPAIELPLTIRLEWTSEPWVDLDLLPLDCTTGDTLSIVAATLANPEILSDTVPAGACHTYRFLWYSGTRSATAKVTITSP
jgi:hypothetical protein